jgi:hypothetical protein
MARINREYLLQRLDEVKPGLSHQPIVEQSTHFIFQNGWIYTYNEEVACRTPSGLPKDLVCAVQADPLLRILSKLPDEEIDVGLSGNDLVIKGKGRKTELPAAREILLPVDKIKLPKKEDWNRIHTDFTDAIGIAMTCVGKDVSMFYTVCVHITPKHIESCDSVQLTRYRLQTGVKEPFMVRGESVKHVQVIAPVYIAEDENFVHFYTRSKLVYSVKKWISEFIKDMDKALQVTGVPTVLPPGLGDAADRAQVFSDENDDNIVVVELTNDALKIVGHGPNGKHTEFKKVKYIGKPLKFAVSPKLLIELVKRHTDCQVSPERRIIVDGGKFTYVAGLYDYKKAETESLED